MTTTNGVGAVKAAPPPNVTPNAAHQLRCQWDSRCDSGRGMVSAGSCAYRLATHGVDNSRASFRERQRDRRCVHERLRRAARAREVIKPTLHHTQRETTFVADDTAAATCGRWGSRPMTTTRRWLVHRTSLVQRYTHSGTRYTVWAVNSLFDCYRTNMDNMANGVRTSCVLGQ